MKDAIGGTFTITAIIVALIIIMCLMAFAVNYSKAFRVKNEVRSIIEKNDGLTPKAQQEITELMRKFNYYLDEQYESVCRSQGYEVFNGLSANGGNGVRFCVKCHLADSNIGETNEDPEYRGAYYSIMTFVDVDIPIINNIIPFTGSLFSVKGETAIIYARHNNSFCDGK